MTHFRSFLLLIVALAVGSTQPLTAQPTNAEAFQQLALACLADAPDTVQAFHFAGPVGMPYLRTRVLAHWQAENRRVFLPDSLESLSDLPRLSVVVEEAQVRYMRADRRQVTRIVTLALRHTLTDAEGALLGETACRESYDDLVPRDGLAALESTSFPETQGGAPPAGWFRRFAQPAILAAATAVTIYLFFSLRNDRADAG